ncbi:MAG: Spo0B domain-containing protein [Bacillota bacterium]
MVWLYRRGLVACLVACFTYAVVYAFKEWQHDWGWMMVGLSMAAIFVLGATLAVHQHTATVEAAAKVRDAVLKARDEQIIALNRKQRHDFLNDLQVITGWLQMGKVARAEEYLEYVREKLARESRIMRVKDPGLALLLLDKHSQAESHGVILDFHIPSELPRWSVAHANVLPSLGGLIGWLVQAAAGKQAGLTFVAEYHRGGFLISLTAPTPAGAGLDQHCDELGTAGWRVGTSTQGGELRVNLWLPVPGRKGAVTTDSVHR